MNNVVLLLGSNMGDRHFYLEKASSEINRELGKISRYSSVYETAPWGKTDQDWFVNACITVATKLPAIELLQRCFAAERALQRVRLERWGPRSLDCDLLIYRDMISHSAELTLPHPRITGRAFVLVPLLEIAPDLQVNGRRASDWLDDLDASDVTPVEAKQPS